jgi:hypothetical protein
MADLRQKRQPVEISCMVKEPSQQNSMPSFCSLLKTFAMPRLLRSYIIDLVYLSGSLAFPSPTSPPPPLLMIVKKMGIFLRGSLQGFSRKRVNHLSAYPSTLVLR